MPDITSEKLAIANLLGLDVADVEVMASAKIPQRLLLNQAIIAGILATPEAQITDPDLLLLVQRMKHERSAPHPYA